MRLGLPWTLLFLCLWSDLAFSAQMPPLPPRMRPRAKLSSPKGSEFKASLGAVLALPPPYQAATWWGNTIATDGDRHCLTYATWTGVYAYIWDRQSAGKAYLLPGWAQLSCPAIVLTGDVLVLADMATAAGGVKVSTFRLTSTNAILEGTLSLGDADNRCPSACLTPAGGVLVVSYRHDSSYNLLSVYRTPAGVWQQPNYNVFVAPPIGISSIATTAINGPDGKVWIVLNRDSSHVIDLARYTEGAFFDFHQALINADTINGTNVMGEMAPNGEFPDVTVARSGTNILLAYQNYRQEWPCEFLASYEVVTAIGSDLKPALVAKNDHLINEVFNPSPIFTTSSGFDLLSWELNPDCTGGPWLHRRFSDGAWSLREEPVYAAQRPNDIAWSRDGWAFWRWADNIPRLTLFPLTETRTVLTLTRQQGNVIVSWTNQKEGDVLQSSEDLKVWVNVGTANPSVVPMVKARQFFRVRR